MRQKRIDLVASCFYSVSELNRKKWSIPSPVSCGVLLKFIIRSARNPEKNICKPAITEKNPTKRRGLLPMECPCN